MSRPTRRGVGRVGPDRQVSAAESPQRSDSVNAPPNADSRPPIPSVAPPPHASTGDGVLGDGSSTHATQQPATDSAVFGAAEALPQVLKVVGSIVAPTTLLTALLFYFGRLHATGMFQYFGVHFTVLDLSVQDYLVRSADGLILPLVIVVGAALLALWMHHLLLGALPPRSRRITLQFLIPVTGTVGLVLVVLAMADATGASIFVTFPEGRGLSLSIGVLLLAYAVRLLRLLRSESRSDRGAERTTTAAAIAEWCSIFLLVSVGLFWAVGSYAAGVGTGRAQQIEAVLPNYPDTVLYNEKSMSLQAPGVQEVVCHNPEAAYRYRYEGLKLVMQSGNQYLFLPAGWTRANGSAILIPRSETMRLEFSGPGQVRSATC
jgi:hypothetical protein